MSTRSGKRIHRSFLESSEKVAIPTSTMSERKTRSKKQKENHMKLKLRENYVSYPTDDENDRHASANKAKRTSNSKKNNVLRISNCDSVTENIKNENLKETFVRETRRTKRFVDDAHCLPVNTSAEKPVTKKRRGKKNKRSIGTETQENEPVKTKNKKKKKGNNSDKQIKDNENHNNTDASINSYSTALGSPFDAEKIDAIKSDIDITKIQDNIIDTACENATPDKSCQKIDISDDSRSENIINTTPLLIESSTEAASTPTPPKPLIREGTFTKESPTQLNGTFTKEVSLSNTLSLPPAGHTPYHSNGKKRSLNRTHSIEKPLNITHSIEKPKAPRPSYIEERQTKVMFSSPIDNPLLSTTSKSRIIKSSMKGSNKSFLHDQDAPSTIKRPSSRKRSFTHGDAEERVKRLRLTEDLAQSVNRLSRPRTTSAIVKSSQKDTPVAKGTPYNQCGKVLRRKLPNFAILHQKQFEKMESLDECLLRKAKRAKKLMSPTGILNVLERSKGAESPKPKKKEPWKPKSHFSTLIPRPINFKFNTNYHVNPFSVTAEKPARVNPALKREHSQPSIKGTTMIAKKIGLKELRDNKCIQEKRNEYRDIIKGVRTNRRFELQMKSRNVQS